MSILYLLIPIAIIFLILAVLFFFWTIKNGQYDDLESQALKIVIEDKIQKHTNNPEQKSTGAQETESASDTKGNEPD